MFPVHGLQTGQVACICAHGNVTAQTHHLNVIMLLARLEQMKCTFICLHARWVTRGQTTKTYD
jgi:hypothetical protein